MKIQFPSIPTAAVIFLLLSAVLLIFSVVEYRAAKADIGRLMDSKARLFLQTVFETGRQSILAVDALEDEMSARLLNNNFLMDVLDQNGLLGESMIRSISERNNVFRINLFDREGHREPGGGEHGRGGGQGMRMGAGRGGMRMNMQDSRDRDDIERFLRSDSTEMVFGFKKGRFGSQERYAAATKRSAGGVIVSVLDVNEIVRMRESFGFASLISGVSMSPDVVYAVFQDEEGIIESGPFEGELSSIRSDPFIQASLEEGAYGSRIVPWMDRELFEAVSPFAVEGYPAGVFRIGFSLEELGTLRGRMAKRLAILSVLLLVFGFAGIGGAILKRQRELLARKLESLESFTDTVLAHTREAVVVFGRDGVIRFLNRSGGRLFGVHAAGAVGAPVSEVIPECAADIDSCFGRDALSREKELTLERQGSRRHLVYSLSHIMRGSEVDSAIMIWNDVTERRRIEERLQRNERMSAMGALASGVAHEIRNPLNAIQMIIQRLGKEFTPSVDEGGEYDTLVRAVRGEIERVNGIIGQFLRFARPSRAELKPVAVRSFIDGLGPILENQVREKDIIFGNSGFDDAVLPLDQEKMRQVFLNLVRNAVDATDSGGRITIGGKKSPDGYRFTVEDTGSGIAQEEVKKIFNLYYSTKPSGTGIGLSLVHQFVSQHEGTIDVDSVPGRGTVFTMTLPEVLSA